MSFAALAGAIAPVLVFVGIGIALRRFGLLRREDTKPLTNVIVYVAAPTSTIDLTLPTGDGIVIEERDPREVLGISFSGVIEPRTPAESSALDALTAQGPWEVPIAKGHALEVTRKGGAYQLDGWARIAPPGIEGYNPAFDVTPAAYITAIITERGVARPDYAASLAGACDGAGAFDEIG